MCLVSIAISRQRLIRFTFASAVRIAIGTTLTTLHPIPAVQHDVPAALLAPADLPTGLVDRDGTPAIPPSGHMPPAPGWG